MTITLVSTTGVELPLQSVDIAVDVDGTGLIALVTQTFANDLADPAEVIYRFPLPSGAAITDCIVRIGDREIRAELRERSEARAEYDEAIAQGRTATLMEQTGAERFELTVGNIAPGEQIEVVIALHGTVTVEGTEATLRFPTLVAPTYGDVRPDPIRVVDGQLGIDTRFTVHLHDSDVTPQVPSHQCQGQAGSVELAGIALDRDIIVRWQVTEALSQARFVPDAADPEHGTIEVVVRTPSNEVGDLPTDVVVLVDRSGSMSGWGEETAAELTKCVVDSLGPDDTVTVIAFDTTPEALPVCSEGAVRPVGQVRERLIEEIREHLTARGGTEMGDALELAADMMPAAAPGRDRVLVLLTDGQYGDEKEAARLRRTRFAGVRIVVVGVDMAVNGGFLARLADGGHVELIESSQRARDVTKRVVAKVRAPRYRGLVIEGAAEQPRTGGVDVYPGAVARIQGRMKRPEGPVTLRAADGTSLDIEVIDSADASIRSRWAAARLADLIDADTDADDTDSPQRRAIVELSIAYRVLCEYTAWIAVDRSGKTVEGPLRRMVQPLASPAGWAGSSAAPARMDVHFMRSYSSPAPVLYSAPPESDASFIWDTTSLLEELQAVIDDLKAGGDLTAEHLEVIERCLATMTRTWRLRFEASLGRVTPGPLGRDTRARLLSTLRRLTSKLGFA